MQNQLKSEVKKRNHRKRVERWLLKNQKFINITAIEKEIDAPKGLIQKFIKYDKKIKDKWIDPIYAVIQRFKSFGLK
ncbi:hypothetical protein [Aquimarina brevivitae]|uniref:Uncharacterized protein n=1 Tax=Aquimarina brevivitae TaxID=323412 RepID=A0A4V2F7K1_9FLAO|nr:hypothetical protein [Aquimarina brevivitae]RZT00100.1 hypothetical protein EV197_1333 [Aquimarina brevivitae]